MTTLILIDALCVLPFVFVSQLRRKTHPLVVLRKAVTLFVAFRLAGFMFGFTANPGSALRLLLPVIAGLLSLVVFNVYQVPDRTRTRSSTDILFAIGVVIASQLLLSATRPSLALPAPVIGTGCAIGG